MRTLLTFSLLVAPVLLFAQQPQTVPVQEANDRIQAVRTGRDEAVSSLLDQVAALRVALASKEREVEQAQKACKPEKDGK